MKKVSTILLALVLILSFASVSMAADDQTITVNPFGLLAGVLNGRYEKSLGNQNSYFISAGLVSLGGVSGIEVGGGYRKYLREQKSGLFAEGSGQFASVQALGSSATGFGIGGICGFKWIYDSGFTVEAGAGVSFVSAQLEGFRYGGFGPVLLLSLGYTW